MSAYALPGLFPPIETFVANEAGNASSSSSSSSTNVLGFGPLHEHDRVFTKSNPNQSNDSFAPSTYALFQEKQDNPDSANGNEPGIHVTDATVDPVRLVRSVTQSLRKTAFSTKQSHLRKRGTKDKLGESNKPCCTPDTSKARASDDVGTFHAPHDEAIEFALAISFNGRKYTAKRTMQRIIQLRDDLISEMDTRRRWLMLRKSKGKNSSQEIANIVDVQIPEIPPLTGDEDGAGVGAGFVGRGFSMLHAMATSYAPTMERWLRSVLAVVPQDSETLMNFLWEPLSHGSPIMDSPAKSCVSLATLGSIKELECATDDDSDSEDEWEG